jgi:hypothetical protein
VKNVFGLVVFAAVVSVFACASLKPVAKTAESVATDLCVLYFGETSSLSVEDVAKTFCETKEQLQPFIDELLAAKQAAGVKAGAAK